MIELPEGLVLAQQANKTLKGKKIRQVFNATKEHKFTFFHGDPLEYGKILTGRTIQSAKGYGMFLDLILDNSDSISIGDGTNMRYGEPGEKIPTNYQLLLAFEDESFLVFTVAMYGFIGVHIGGVANEKYHRLSADSISPLDDKYTEEVFHKLFSDAKKDMNTKALMATEQRIPGVGNGTLQDILFNAKINPKRKISTLSDTEKKNLFHSLKSTLQSMVAEGGRDTQTDLYGNKGGYISILSAKTYKQPCPVCKGTIVKEAFMGGTIYYCTNCQPL